MIIEGSWVLPVTDKPIRSGGVRIQNGVISAAGKIVDIERVYPDEDVISFKNGIIMPGFVNLHSHIEYSAMHGRCRGGSFIAWIKDLIKAARNMDANDWLDSSRYGAELMIESGITSIGDITKTDTAFRAIEEAGLRGVVFLEVLGFDDDKIDRVIHDLYIRLEKSANIKNNRINTGISPHAPYTVSRKLFEALAEISDERGLRIMTHISETAEEEVFVRDGTGVFADSFKKIAGWGDVTWDGTDLGSVEYLDACGILSERTIAAHAVWVDEADIEIFRARGVSIAHCPRSNAYLGTGSAPVRRMLDAGVTVGLGTDSLASNQSIDIFEEIRAIDRSINPEERIRMATINGARALGLGDRVGSIEPGKFADIIVVENDSDDPYMVISSSKSDLRLVMVEGNVLYET
ncbi:MAG: metal-dependent hydrolase [Candidatus Syntrophoarchaeum caldarius]|uniref:Metal-dependent hydrolase n=1 Tax=Candidatus Syntropharchaeum caldarium TaxID=1838285 RepID=A0A1F2PAT9_9EURY|nr:MAG: metal-dependent hydrolase [Candidatus Syntrophoarchaeum caldarius]